jgi:hypothetical protein
MADRAKRMPTAITSMIPNSLFLVIFPNLLFLKRVFQVYHKMGLKARNSLQ